jgi:hypothetical protein
MNGASNLSARIADALKDRSTHQAMPGVALEAGLVIATEAEGLSKRDRALAALDGKSPRELGEIADLGDEARAHLKVVHSFEKNIV